MNKRLWIVLAVLVVAIFGGLVWYSKTADKNKPDELAYVDQLDGTKLITKDDIIQAKQKQLGRDLTKEEKDAVIGDHYVGPTDAKVVVVEYEDFACSHCQAFHEYAEQIQDDYSDQVLFIMRDYSLNYPNSLATLSAAEATMKLGGNDAFWKMSKLLFQDETWTGQAVPVNERKEIFNKYAKEAGVDVKQFNNLLAGTKDNGIQEKIDRDSRIGKNMGVSGTPTWIVNGKKVESSTEDEIRTAIEKALAESKSDKD